jgi:hypothetical protein
VPSRDEPWAGRLGSGAKTVGAAKADTLRAAKAETVKPTRSRGLQDAAPVDDTHVEIWELVTRTQPSTI